MDLSHLPIGLLVEALWNPNQMEDAMRITMKRSISRFGMVQNLVVRPRGNGTFEVISGNWRLRVLRELGWTHIPCVVVELNNGQARLLAQALNRIQGEDDLGLKAEVVREMLKSLPEREILAVLPETAESLKALACLGQEDLAAHLQAWQAAQAARLHHLQLQLTQAQLELVQEALAQAMTMSPSQEDGGSPNRRGTALAAVCRAYLASMGEPQ